MKRYLFVIIFIIALFLFKWQFQPIAYHGDISYYYLHTESGELPIDELPVTFCILQCLSVLVAGDIKLAIRLCLLFSSVFAGVTILFLFKERCNRNIGLIAGMTSMLIFLFSPAQLTINCELVKNSIGIVFLCVYFYFFNLKEPESRFNMMSLFFTALLTALTHVLCFGILVCYTILMSVTSWRTMNIKQTIMNALPCLITLILIYCGWVIFGGYLTSYEKMFVSILKYIYEPSSTVFEHTLSGIYYNPYLTLLTGIVMSFYSFIKKTERFANYVSLTVLTFILILPIWHPGYHQYAWRLSLMTFIPTCLISGLMLTEFKSWEMSFTFGALLALPFIWHAYYWYVLVSSWW